MGIEIERKFLVKGDGWRSQSFRNVYYRQGYLNDAKSCSIRVRIAEDKAYLNIKSAILGIFRHEYEYEIPLAEANEMLDSFSLGAVIAKRRFFVEYAGHTWEVDVFDGDNDGLIVAEIELSAEDEAFDIPNWVGDEVSDDPRYYNVCLVKHPYKDW